MTRTEIAEMVDGIATAAGLPAAYHHFLTPQVPPYLVYLIERPDYYADNVNYQKIARVAIEFYYDQPDPELMDQIEDMIPTAYTVGEEEYIQDEHMYVTIIEMEVPLNGEQD